MFAAFVGVLVWFGHQIYEFLLPPADTITIPSFVGQSAADATAAALQMNLSAQVVDHGTSDRYPQGVVMSQRPEAGTTVRAGRQVDFVVSDGIISRLMPDLRYQSMREVSYDLVRTKLQVGHVTYVKSEVVPADHVISQNPLPLANVVEGDSVDLVVSKGSGVSIVRVPSFIGMKIDDARALAAKSGINFGQIVWTPLGKKGPAHGVVARQSIPPNTKISPYQPVSLQVSAGPNESGYIIRQVRVLASIPLSSVQQPGQSVAVVLRVRDATGQYDAYSAFAQPGQKLDFTVTAVGTSLVDLYVNNALVGETRLGTEPARIYDEKTSPSPSPGGN
ncbi:MAG TPA: PASTA domain-containing protein [Candidatus Baltobacteraceae bacterium]|nr:PASTA domain-containing protein [Candidatus Baltobacteraceae bacterium]